MFHGVGMCWPITVGRVHFTTVTGVLKHPQSVETTNLYCPTGNWFEGVNVMVFPLSVSANDNAISISAHVPETCADSIIIGHNDLFILKVASVHPTTMCFVNIRRGVLAECVTPANCWRWL